jgi:hypothetical protein
MCTAARPIGRNSDDALALTLGGNGEYNTKAKGSYEWVVQLAVHLPALPRLRIKADSGWNRGILKRFRKRNSQIL